MADSHGTKPEEKASEFQVPINEGAAWDAIFLLEGGPVSAGYDDMLAWHFACFVRRQTHPTDEQSQPAVM